MNPFALAALPFQLAACAAGATFVGVGTAAIAAYYVAVVGTAQAVALATGLDQGR